MNHVWFFWEPPGYSQYVADVSETAVEEEYDYIVVGVASWGACWPQRRRAWLEATCFCSSAAVRSPSFRRSPSWDGLSRRSRWPTLPPSPARLHRVQLRVRRHQYARAGSRRRHINARARVPGAPTRHPGWFHGQEEVTGNFVMHPKMITARN